MCPCETIWHILEMRRYGLMIWHILYLVYCIDQDARGGSLCQEASLVGCAIFFVPLRKRMPEAAAIACRWRAGLSHLLFPRNRHVYRRERERERESAEREGKRSMHSSIHHCQGFTEHSTTAPHIAFLQERRHVTAILSRCQFQFVSVSVATCFQHATSSRRQPWHLCGRWE